MRGGPPEDAELADALDELGNPDAVTLSMLVAAVQDVFNPNADNSLANWLQDRRNSRQIPHRMEAVGYVRVRNDDAKDGRWKTGGRVVVYARRELSVGERIAVVRRLVAEAR